eukprot:3037792-Rhodomonas_salina.5
MLSLARSRKPATAARSMHTPSTTMRPVRGDGQHSEINNTKERAWLVWARRTDLVRCGTGDGRGCWLALFDTCFGGHAASTP